MKLFTVLSALLFVLSTVFVNASYAVEKSNPQSSYSDYANKKTTEKKSVEVKKKATKSISFFKKIIQKIKKVLAVDTTLLVILAILLPWLAVGLKTNWNTPKTLISVLLWLLLWVPGIVFALLVVFDVV